MEWKYKTYWGYFFSLCQAMAPPGEVIRLEYQRALRGGVRLPQPPLGGQVQAQVELGDRWRWQVVEEQVLGGGQV